MKNPPKQPVTQILHLPLRTSQGVGTTAARYMGRQMTASWFPLVVPKIICQKDVVNEQTHFSKYDEPTDFRVNHVNPKGLTPFTKIVTAFPE